MQDEVTTKASEANPVSTDLAHPNERNHLQIHERFCKHNEHMSHPSKAITMDISIDNIDASAIMSNATYPLYQEPIVEKKEEDNNLAHQVAISDEIRHNRTNTLMQLSQTTSKVYNNRDYC